MLAECLVFNVIFSGFCWFIVPVSSRHPLLDICLYLAYSQKFFGYCLAFLDTDFSYSILDKTLLSFWPYTIFPLFHCIVGLHVSLLCPVFLPDIWHTSFINDSWFVEVVLGWSSFWNVSYYCISDFTFDEYLFVIHWHYTRHVFCLSTSTLLCKLQVQHTKYKLRIKCVNHLQLVYHMLFNGKR